MHSIFIAWTKELGGIDLAKILNFSAISPGINMIARVFITSLECAIYIYKGKGETDFQRYRKMCVSEPFIMEGNKDGVGVETIECVLI